MKFKVRKIIFVFLLLAAIFGTAPTIFQESRHLSDKITGALGFSGSRVDAASQWQSQSAGGATIEKKQYYQDGEGIIIPPGKLQNILLRKTGCSDRLFLRIDGYIKKDIRFSATVNGEPLGDFLSLTPDYQSQYQEFDVSSLLSAPGKIAVAHIDLVASHYSHIDSVSLACQRQSKKSFFSRWLDGPEFNVSSRQSMLQEVKATIDKNLRWSVDSVEQWKEFSQGGGQIDNREAYYDGEGLIILPGTSQTVRLPKICSGKTFLRVRPYIKKDLSFEMFVNAAPLGRFNGEVEDYALVDKEYDITALLDPALQFDALTLKADNYIDFDLVGLACETNPIIYEQDQKNK